MVENPASGNTASSIRFSAERTSRVALGRQNAHHDDGLILRFAAGDESAFVEMVKRHEIRIFALSFSVLRNRADAEEIVQDTFVRAHRGLVNFRGESSLATWLTQIAINLARNRVRHDLPTPHSEKRVSNVSCTAVHSLRSMTFLTPIWRSFRDIPADDEASFVSSSGNCSLDTLEVSCTPGIRSFALTERQQPDIWRWAVVGAREQVVEEGWEPTQTDAKKAAVEALGKLIAEDN